MDAANYTYVGSRRRRADSLRADVQVAVGDAVVPIDNPMQNFSSPA
jgi:hypothetical protein